MSDINADGKSRWSQNLIYLRTTKGESQLETATALDLSRSTYANYESDENLPNINTINKILGHFNVSFEDFMFSNFENVREGRKKEKQITQQKVRDNVRDNVRQSSKVTPESYLAFLSTQYEHNKLSNVYEVDSNDVVAVHFLISHQKHLGDLECLQLSGLGDGLHIRFQIVDDSMYPTIKAGDKIVATHVPKPATTLHEGQIYLALDKANVVACRRIYKVAEDEFKLVSDNDIFKSYNRKSSDLKAVFRVVEMHTRHLRNESAHVQQQIKNLQKEIAKKIDNIGAKRK